MGVRQNSVKTLRKKARGGNDWQVANYRQNWVTHKRGLALWQEEDDRAWG